LWDRPPVTVALGGVCDRKMPAGTPAGTPALLYADFVKNRSLRVKNSFANAGNSSCLILPCSYSFTLAFADLRRRCCRFQVMKFFSFAIPAS
jgi:hypothetical protein